MYKKSLIILSAILFVLCICTSSVFATDGNTANNVKNGVSNVTNSVVDGVSRMGSDVRNGIGAVENGIEDTFDMNDTDNGNNADNNNNDMAPSATDTTGGTGATGDYTTTRTADTAGTTDDGMANIWVWMIVAVAAIVIIGLVWYYGTQNTTHHDE